MYKILLNIKTIQIILYCALFLYSVPAILKYPGSSILFTLFCFVYITQFLLAYYGYKSYFYIYFSALTLLGFWFKTCSYLIFEGEFIEPVGFFDGSPQLWDSSIIVCLVAVVSILAFRVIQMILMKGHAGVLTVNGSLNNAPFWYKKYRKIIWFISIISIILIAYLNIYFGINQAGLIPKIHLPLKINALIIWCLYTGFAFWLCTIIWWDRCLNLEFNITAITFEGALSSISVLSRSLFLVHCLPYLIAIYFNRKILKVPIRRYVIYFFFLIIGFIFTLSAVAELRRNVYFGDFSMNILFSFIEKKNQEIASPEIFLLLSKRWVGIEGVLAATSYPDLGMDLFKKAWVAIPSYQEKPIYEHIANSIYISPDYPNAKNYNFMSIPGLVSMLYFSGNLGIVFIGIFIILWFFSLMENLISLKLNNPFTTSLLGMLLAMMLHQFGGAYVNLIQLFEIFFVLLVIFMIEKISNLISLKYAS